jgi:NO-binding membrane sensor protein with MHYT domain
MLTVAAVVIITPIARTQGNPLAAGIAAVILLLGYVGFHFIAFSDAQPKRFWPDWCPDRR